MGKDAIAFESQLLMNNNKTGIGWCADNLIKELAKDSNYIFYLDYFKSFRHREMEKKLHSYEKYGIKLKPCVWFHNIFYKLIWPIIPIPYRFFFRKKRDITQFFNYVIPPGVKGKKVTIIHDMAYKACPDTVNKKTKKWLDLNLKKSCIRADAIITVSEFSKSEIIKYLKIPKEKIHVMHLGVDFSKFHTEYTEEQARLIRDKYGLENEYLLYLGTIEPRKNIRALIEAYAVLHSKDAYIPQLVLSGGNGWLNDDIYGAVKELQLEDKVIFTGYVDQEDSPVLMKNALAFLFPSLYEGFGMPVIEAMACGTPVMTSNSSSLAEIAGDAALLVDEKSVKSISEGIRKLIKDTELREELSEKGLKHCRQFTWERSANVLKEVYRKLLSDNLTS